MKFYNKRNILCKISIHVYFVYKNGLLNNPEKNGMTPVSGYSTNELAILDTYKNVRSSFDFMLY